MSISEKLKLFITENNIDQKDLAKIAGVTEGAVSQWLSGTTLPKIGRLQKITEHFGLPVSTLIDETNSPMVNTSTTAIPEFDDYTYALCNEVKGLSDVQKDALLQMAKAMKVNG